MEKLKELKSNLFDFIDLLAEQKKWELSTKITNETMLPVFNKSVGENFLKKRGYFLSGFVLNGKPIWMKDFVCVQIEDNLIRVWHDLPKAKPSFIHQSFITGLPIALNYFERI